MPPEMIWTIVGTIATCVATGIAVIGIIISIMRNFKEDILKDQGKLWEEIKKNEERLFQLALGKDFRECLKEELRREAQ